MRAWQVAGFGKEEVVVKRLTFSKSFLLWHINAFKGDRKDHKQWQVGLRRSSTGQLLGFISGAANKLSVPATLANSAKGGTAGEAPSFTHCIASEINFFVLHPDLRGMRAGNTNLARVMITEITRRVYSTGVRLALYTGASELPHAVSRSSYYLRRLNVRKLVESKFVSMADDTTIEELEVTIMFKKKNNSAHDRLWISRCLLLVIQVTYAVPPEIHLSPGSRIRPFEASDAVQCLKLLDDNFHANKTLRRVFDEAELCHVLLPQLGVVYTWVVEDSTCTVTDFVSFYSVPITMLAKGSVQPLARIEQAYLWYHTATSMPVAKLILNVLILAKAEGFDLFIALDIAGLTGSLTEAGFKEGTGSLRYYLFNWRGYTMPSSDVAYIPQ